MYEDEDVVGDLDIEGLPWDARLEVPEIRTHATKTVVAVREYVRAQVDTWQRVPYLAFHSDGLNGYSDVLPLTYKYGYYVVSSSMEAFGGIVVDCANGELVRFGGFGRKPPNPVHPVDVLKLAARLKALNAGRIQKQFLARISKGRSPAIDEGEYERWQTRIRANYDIQEVFRPAEPRAYPNFQYCD